MEHRIESTIDTLVKAYFHGHLVHGEPCACAVGNMCNGNPYWINVINGTHQQIYYEVADKLLPRYLKYSPEELIRIEYEFEGRNGRGGQHLPSLFKDNDPDGFDGLCRVFDVLEEDVDKDYFTDMERKINIVEILREGAVPEITC